MNSRLLRIVLGLVALGFATPEVASAQANRPRSLDSYRRHALTREGDVKRGARLFAEDPRLACAQCHSIDGRAGKAGPDLYAVGEKFGRRELIDAVLLPSASIAPGYGTVIVETSDGEEYQGTLRRSSGTELQLMRADGQAVTIPRETIREQRGGSLSLMPEDLQTGLSVEEFTDLIDYLASLRQPESTLTSNQGMPREIPPASSPIAVRPFFSEEFKRPRGKVQTGLTAFHEVPGSSNRFLVLHQEGLVWLVEKHATGESKSVFADLTAKVFFQRGPNGLLDAAFHPRFRENRKYYLKYQIFEGGKAVTVIEEKKFGPDFRSDSGEPGRAGFLRRSIPLGTPSLPAGQHPDGLSGGEDALGPPRIQFDWALRHSIIRPQRS